VIDSSAAVRREVVMGVQADLVNARGAKQIDGVAVNSLRAAALRAAALRAAASCNNVLARYYIDTLSGRLVKTDS
jgi:hypothetical protein